MKNIIRNIAIASVFATGLSLTSCEDMMTVDTGDKAYENAQDTLYSYLGIMRAMQDVAERQVILGEIRGDLVSSSDYTTDTLYAISNFDNPQDQSCSMLKVSDYYNVINNCNFYIYNADTSAVKSNVRYMVPEYAQVKAVRAWAYLQLVKNYKQVPFITEPVSNLGVIENFDYSASLVDKNNLVDKLLEDGLANFLDTSYPQYGSTSSTWGSWQNGDRDISARLCFIPIRVVLGDLYLLRGASKGDYEKAARYYYEYLKNEATPMASEFCKVTVNRSSGKISRDNSYSTNWGLWASAYTYTATSNEVISLIPSSANAGLGNMLTRVADIYGYKPTSAQSSDVITETDDDGNTKNKQDANGNDVYEAAGRISVTKTYKRQFAPSNAYQDVVNKQTYTTYANVSSTLTPTYTQNCDARYYMSVEDAYDDNGESYPLCCKAAKGSTFFYTIPTYRKTLIWLRLAEAINRAGYPEFAFGILKEGLNRYTIPEVGNLAIDKLFYFDLTTGMPTTATNPSATAFIKRDKKATDGSITAEVYVSVDDATVKYEYDATGAFVPTTTSVNGVTWSTVEDTIRTMIYQQRRPLYYVTDTTRIQQFNSFLDFSDMVWDDTYGIHAKGAGGLTNFMTNDGKIMSSIYGTLGTATFDYATKLAEQGVTLATAPQADIINAVENIIVDELALETAFEGNRFTDLVRIAEHKNASGYDGTEWLAQKIANRGTKAAVGTTAAVNDFNSSIYAKLKNQDNWYFAMPSWTTR